MSPSESWSTGLSAERSSFPRSSSLTSGSRTRSRTSSTPCTDATPQARCSCGARATTSSSVRFRPVLQATRRCPCRLILLDGQQRLTSLHRVYSSHPDADVVFNVGEEKFQIQSAATAKDPRWIRVAEVLATARDRCYHSLPRFSSRWVSAALTQPPTFCYISPRAEPSRSASA